jgi:hypothetical protein
MGLAVLAQECSDTTVQAIVRRVPDEIYEKILNV